MNYSCIVDAVTETMWSIVATQGLMGCWWRRSRSPSPASVGNRYSTGVLGTNQHMLMGTQMHSVVCHCQRHHETPHGNCFDDGAPQLNANHINSYSVKRFSDVTSVAVYTTRLARSHGGG